MFSAASCRDAAAACGVTFGVGVARFGPASACGNATTAAPGDALAHPASFAAASPAGSKAEGMGDPRLQARSRSQQTPADVIDLMRLKQTQCSIQLVFLFTAVDTSTRPFNWGVASKGKTFYDP